MGDGVQSCELNLTVPGDISTIINSGRAMRRITSYFRTTQKKAPLLSTVGCLFVLMNCSEMTRRILLSSRVKASAPRRADLLGCVVAPHGCCIQYSVCR